MRLLILTLIVGLAYRETSSAEPPVDACRAGIPSSVGRALTRRFPAYRLPLVTDNVDEDVRFNRAHGGNGCLSVASADFDGDGRKEFAVGLTPRQGDVPLVVVALARKDTWLFSTLKSWAGYRMRLYVAAVPPGFHTRSEGLDVPLQPNERQSLRCRYAAVEVGATESTGIVYCYTNSGWLHVWVSD